MAFEPSTIEILNKTVTQIYHGKGVPRFRVLEKRKRYYYTYTIGHEISMPDPPSFPLSPAYDWVPVTDDTIVFNPGTDATLFMYCTPIIGKSTRNGYLKREV